jgi:HAE1 family hydrophobic/amphiphilic exporter-1
MPKESSPVINIPFFSITAIYPGADPKSVEEQVVQKLEDKITSVDNVSDFKSISANNV